MIPFGVHSLVEYPFAYAYFLLPMGLMIGMVEREIAPLDRWRAWTMSKPLAAMAVAAWCAVGGWSVYEYFLIEEDFRVTRFESMRIGKTPDDYEIPTVQLATHMGAMLRTTRIQAKPGMDAADLRELERVGQRFGYGVLMYRYALALALNGDPQKSSMVFRQIKGMFGERYYASIKAEAMIARDTRWPQLKAVELP